MTPAEARIYGRDAADPVKGPLVERTYYKLCARTVTDPAERALLTSEFLAEREKAREVAA